IVKRPRQIMFRPDVLANRYADFFFANKKRLDGLSRLEIALLVEHIVSRQKRFVSFPDGFAAFEQSGGVSKWFATSFVAMDEPDEHRCIADAAVHFPQYLQIPRYKPGLEDELLWRIPSDRHLRRHHDSPPRRGKPLICADDRLAISPQIPHGWVNLSETN